MGTPLKRHRLILLLATPVLLAALFAGLVAWSGAAAEREYRAVLDTLETSGKLTVEHEHYQRGLLHSSATLVIRLSGGGADAWHAVHPEGATTAPRLLLHNTLYHNPVQALARGGVRVVSQIPAAGQPELPVLTHYFPEGSLLTLESVASTQTVTGTLTVPGFHGSSPAETTIQASWEPIDGEFHWSMPQRQLSFAARLPRIDLRDEASGERSWLQGAVLDIAQAQHISGLWAGHLRFELDEAGVVAGGNTDVTLDGLSMAVTNSIEGDYLTAHVEAGLGHLDSPDGPFGPASIALRADRLRTSALLLLQQAAQDPAQSMNWMVAALDLLTGSPELHLDHLDVTTPYGPLQASLSLRLDGTQLGDNLFALLDPHQLSRRLSGRFGLSITDTLLREALLRQGPPPVKGDKKGAPIQSDGALDPMLEAMIQEVEQEGWIVRDNGSWRLDARIENGSLYLNDTLLGPLTQLIPFSP